MQKSEKGEKALQTATREVYMYNKYNKTHNLLFVCLREQIIFYANKCPGWRHFYKRGRILE